MKALITGGTGFIGLHLARTLAARGWSVTLVDRPGGGQPDPEVRAVLSSGPHVLVERDLRDAAALASLGTDFTAVFHLAALLGVAAVRREPLAVLRQNIEMQLRAMDFAARQTALRRFVYASTSEVYAGTLTHFSLTFPTPEHTPLALPDLGEPRTSYMLSKIYGEALVHHSGLPFTTIRPHNVYGPRMGTRHVVPELMQRIAATPEGASLEIFSPDHSRTFCYVQDAVDMTIALVERDGAAGGTFNVGTEEPEIRMRDLAARIVRLMGRSITIADGPTTPGSPARRQPDVSRTIATGGVGPCIDLDEGLRRTYEWYGRRLPQAAEGSAR